MRLVIELGHKHFVTPALEADGLAAFLQTFCNMKEVSYTYKSEGKQYENPKEAGIKFEVYDDDSEALPEMTLRDHCKAVIK